jgi:hypothetical protein
MNDERTYGERQSFEDSSISDTESLSGGGAAAAGEEEGPGITAAQAEELSPCQEVYEGSGNEKKVLYLMCIGLNHVDDLPLFSFENEPWSQLPKTSLVRPKNTDYGKEVSRRAMLYSICPVPRPSNWKRAQIMEWLEENPVVDAKCIEFLTNEVFRLRVVLETAQQQQIAAASSEAGGGRGQNWRGSVPYLRIIMCLTQDRVKALFLTRAIMRTRQELDARNSDTR